MKYLFICCLSIFLFDCGAQPKPDVTQLTWLEGTWKRADAKPGKEGFEIWTMDEGVLTGRGISLSNGDTTFVEKLSIKLIDGMLYYIAEVPQNPEPTLFKIVDLKEGYFKSENPEHDFPKEIVYQLKEDKLVASISADGQGMTFSFERK
ncbi:MAG: DUF6265 family protein [Marinoscillum sp.]